MRVISGKAKGRTLLTREGEATRPTADYFKEVLFDCLQFDIPGSRFLDLFSGSGAIAIEALSRGAEEAVLVEQNGEALACIDQNLKSTGLAAQARVLRIPVEKALLDLEARGELFDFIFMDPPYEKGFEDAVFALCPGKLLAEDGIMIVESAAVTQYQPVGWTLYKEKKNKKTKLSFWKYEGEKSSE